jgi:hypothetical protein
MGRKALHPVLLSQIVGPPTPDESVILFVEGELRASGRLDGISAMTYLMRIGRAPTPAQKAGFRLALAMYGERVDPSAHALIREAISARA